LTAIVWDPKDPLETVTGELDWSDDLAQGDAVSASTWAIVTTDGGNLAIVDGTVFASPFAQVKVSGGTDKFNYELRNTITTAAGETLVAVVMLPVRAKR